MRFFKESLVLTFLAFFGFLLLVLAESHVQSEPITSFSDANSSELQSQFESAEWMILFHADWCGPCQATKPHFHKFAAWAKTSRPELRVIGINYADSPILLARFGITSLPTIYHVHNGEIRNFSDRRETLRDIFENDAWKNVTPSPKRFAPYSTFGNTTSAVARIGHFLAVLLLNFANLHSRSSQSCKPFQRFSYSLSSSL